MKSLWRTLIVVAGLALVTLAPSLRAGWKTDPNFRPVPSLGFNLPAVTNVLPDGRFIANAGRQRLNADGSVDPTFHSPGDIPREIWVAPSGRLWGMRYNSDTAHYDLVRLADNGEETSSAVVGFNYPPILVGFLPDDRFYIIGSTGSPGESAYYGVVRRINPDGSLDTSFDSGAGVGQPGSISSGLPLADGGLLLGGWFTSFAGVARTQLVRLHADGSLDPTFDLGPESLAPPPPSALAIDSSGRVIWSYVGQLWRCDPDGGNKRLLLQTAKKFEMSLITSIHVLAGDDFLIQGDFDKVASTSRPWIARVNADGTMDPSFVPAVELSTPPWEPAFFFEDQKIYVQTNQARLARLLANGTLDPTFHLPGASLVRAHVRAVAADDQGRVYIGGDFTSVDGSSRAGFARLLSDGSVDPTFDPGAGLVGAAQTIAMAPGGKVLVGGSFVSAGGGDRPAVARFNGDGSLDASFDAGMNDGAVINAIVVQPSGAIVIGGTFTSAGGVARTNLARLQPDGTIDPAFEIVSMGGVVNHLESLPDGGLLVAGFFDGFNGSTRWSVMKLDADGAIDPSFDPQTLTRGFDVGDAATLSDGSVLLAGVPQPSLIWPTVLLSGPVVSLSESGGKHFETRPYVGARVPAVLVAADGGYFASALPYAEDAAAFGQDAYATLARFHADGSRDNLFVLEFARGAADRLVQAPDGTILAAGDFIEADGMAFTGVMRLVPESRAPRLANISTRGYVGTDDDVLIAGFYVSGDEPQRVLIRGIAKNLEQYDIPHRATQASIHVYRNGENTPLAENSLWYQTIPSAIPTANRRLQDHFERLGAFPLTTSDDAALLLDLPAGGYTVQMRAATLGIGLVEVYDANGIGADRKLINMSTRGRVGIGDEKLIAGFVIGEGTKRVLIRAVGPAIADSVAGTLLDPQLELVRQPDGSVVTTNDNWSDNANAADIAAASLQVSGLQLADGSADAALLVDLPAGGYTVIVSGVGGTTGIALAEVYEVE